MTHQEIEEMSDEQLKYWATNLFSDASSIRNKNRRKWLETFVKGNIEVINSKEIYEIY